MEPLGLSSETSDTWISGGKGSHQTTGASGWEAPNQMLPALSWDASQYPRQSGGAGTRSVQGVGQALAVARSACQSRKACFVASSSQMVAYGHVWNLVTRAMRGERRVFPLGIPNNAWINFPCNCWSFLTWM